ncbi:MAG TPA: hypothetical protein VI306_22040 [Pyrinomonadaceae bacterium]
MTPFGWVKLAVLGVALLPGFSVNVASQIVPTERPALPRHPDPDNQQLIERYSWVYEYHFNSDEKKLLTPALEDQERFASLLRTPDTGLVKLFPWSRWRRVISIDDLGDGRTPVFNLYASTYSFSKNRYGNALNGFVDPRLGWGELKLIGSRFFTGFMGESLGVLVALGDVPIETVTPETEGVIGLTKITPPTDYVEASSLSRRNRGGFELDKFSYGSSLPVLANTTYVLRSTSNRRADVLVAFYVLHVAPDGSVTIVWRKLKSYSKPDWKRRLS